VASGIKVRVHGERELSAALRRLRGEVPSATRDAARKAAELVVRNAKPRVPIGPGEGGHARSSIKVGTTGAAASVQGGGPRFPYYPWLEFGGRVGRKNSVYRKRIRKGRYIYPALAATAARRRALMQRQIAGAARRSGLTVR
jgi:hypothetical protein